MRDKRMLDDVDIINDRLNKEISKLEKELTVLRDRHEIAHANLDQARNQIKSNQELEVKLTRLQKKYDEALRCLSSIASGAIDPEKLAKRKLQDLE